jgi:hypothetical protein
MIASIKVAEKKRLSQTIVPRWNSHGLVQAALRWRTEIDLVDAEIVVRIFDKSIPGRLMPAGRFVLAFSLRLLHRFCFDSLCSACLRMIILGREIDCRHLRQGLDL